MKKYFLLLLIGVLLLTGCKTEPEVEVEIPVYKINYSPASKAILPAIYACAAELPEAIFNPTESYIEDSDLSKEFFVHLGEPDTLPSFSAPLAYDEILLITYQNNPVTEWNDFKIINVMNGRIDSWEYFGSSGDIELWLPPEQDEVRDIFNQNILEDNPVTFTAKINSDFREIVNKVNSNPFALGLIPASFSVSNLNSISLGIQVPLLALLDKNPDEIQQRFIGCLQGETGQSELEKSYDPLP